MNQTIFDLWNGEIAPCEHCGSHDEEANRLIGDMERHRESLWQELSGEQREKFRKYIDSSDDYIFRTQELAFRDGFCLGSRLATESLLG